MSDLANSIAPDTRLSAPLHYAIPVADEQEFLREVTSDERARIRELLSVFRAMARARSPKLGAMNAALIHRHLGWGWSAKALLDQYRVYRDGGHKPGDWRKLGPVYPRGDWRVLLRNYRVGSGVLPGEFVRWLGEQWAQFRGRSDCVNALWRHVVHAVWLAGQPVPGYGTIDEWCRRCGRARPHPKLIRPGELPEGWSAATFRRHLPKRKVTRAQVANGYLAAHTHQPDQVLTDRAPLMPLQYIFLDDSRPDFRCLHFARGRGEIVYPLLVLGLDAAAGVDVANCAKPRALKSPEAEDALERKARHGVTQDMSLLCVTNTLRRFGRPPWPITFVHENAAACVPDEARRMIREAFGDAVRFEATGTVKSRLCEYGFAERGGAPYDKAPIEAFWRILMTQLARTPGSTGPRYDTQPPELKEIERYTLALVDRAGGLESIVSRLRSPLLDFTQAHAAIEDALRLLRFRTKHSLQGFGRVREWRRSPADPYRPIEELLLLPAGEQEAVSDIIERLECPAERFCRLLRGVEMTPVDDDLLTYLEGPRRPVTVRAGKITVSSQAHGDDELIFREVDHPLLDEDAEGKAYEAAITRDGGRIVLTDAGRILGSVARQGRVSRADTAALHREQGRVSAARKADRVALAGYYLADTNDALAELRAHNEAVLETAPELRACAAGAVAERKAPSAQTAAEKQRNARRAQALTAHAEAQLHGAD